MMNIIKIDYDKMNHTINCYKKSIQTLNTDLNTLNSNIKMLKNEWKGQAQEAFFSNIYQNFEKAMKNDIEHLEFLKSQLEETMKSFKEIDQKHKNLSIEKQKIKYNLKYLTKIENIEKNVEKLYNYKDIM